MKQKFKTKIALSTLTFLLIGLGVFQSLVPISQAASSSEGSVTEPKTYQSTQITAEITTNKTVRAVLADGSVVLKYDATKLSPSIQFGKDSLDKAYFAPYNFLSYLASNPIIDGYYVGLTYGLSKAPECPKSVKDISNGQFVSQVLFPSNAVGAALLSLLTIPNPSCRPSIINKESGITDQFPRDGKTINFTFPNWSAISPEYKKWLDDPDKHDPFKVTLGLFGILSLDNSPFSGSVFDASLGSSPTNFDIELFKTKEDLVSACAKSLGKDTCTDEELEKFKYSDEKVTGTSTGVNPSGAGPIEQTVNTILNLLAAIISPLFTIVSSILAFIVTGLVVPLIEALIGIQTYKDSFVAVILPGWIVLRNLSNIFFILVLLVIGLATIFRVQGYQYKQLLVNLIIAAVLVNFSLVIGQSILGLADTVQTQLLPPPKTNGVFEFTPVRRLAYVLIAGPSLNNLSKSALNIIKPGTAGEGVGNLFLPFISLAMALGTTVLFVAIAAMLFIRIIALWILLMLSPLAYVAGVLPNTKSFQKMWWDKFLKYAFYAVILAFFLNIAAFISSNGSTEVDLSLTQSIMADLVGKGNNPGFTTQYGNISDFVFTIGSNLLVMVFLIIGMKATSSLSLIGSKAIGDFAEKGFKMPFVAGAAGAVGAAKATGRGAASLADLGRDKLSLRLGDKGLFGNKRAGNIAAGLLNFGATKKQFGGILADMKTKRKGEVDSMSHDIAASVGGRIPLVRSDQSYKFDENHQTAVREARTEFENHDRDKLLEELAKLKGKTGRDDQTRSQVLIELVSEKGGMEDLMLQEGFAADRAGYMGFMNKKLADGELTEAQGGYLAKKLSDEGIKNKESWYTHGYGYNDSGRLRLLNNSVEDASGANVHDAEQAAIEIAEARAVAAALPSADPEKVKKDAREAYIEALSPVRKELYRNGEYLKKMVEAQERDQDKIGLRAYAQDAPGSEWAPKSADGTYRFSDHTVRKIVGSTADEMDAVAGSLNIKTRQRLIKAYSDPAKQTEAISDFANEIQSKHLTNTGEAMARDEAEKIATTQFDAFSGSLLRHNLNTGKDVVKGQKEAIQSVITKNLAVPEFKDFSDSHNNIDPHIKNSVVKSLNEFIANPSTLSNQGLEAVIAPTNRVGVNTGHLATGARKYVGDTFAARFNAKTAGLTGTANGNKIRDQISEAFQATMIGHPNLSVGETGFKAAFEAELRKQVTNADALPQINNIIKQVTTGLS